MPRENAENMLMFLGNYLTVGVNETKFSSVSNTAFWSPTFPFWPQICQAGLLVATEKGSHGPNLENLSENPGIATDS